jgi:multisubunit Na+/H+ antiporter MnhB subunit
VIVIWALFISPRPRIQVSKEAALAIELVLLGFVAAGLALTGPLWLGIAYGAVALASGLVSYAFKP